MSGTSIPRLNGLLRPLHTFINTEASGGILLLLATVLALLWSNSPWGADYFNLWHTTLTIDLGGHGLTMDLSHWINDGLMAVFFLVVGLEIKRELLVGELASVQHALLPIGAAIGGAIMPALLYVAITAGSPEMRGWGVPMATDIAFVLAIVTVLGQRVPVGLKVFLTALAIVDDLIAVLVIAVFYTTGIDWGPLLAGLAVFLILLAVNRARIHSILIYAMLGVVMWVAFVQSGVHATVAGVLLAMAIPARTQIDTSEFLSVGQAALDIMRRSGATGMTILSNIVHQSALQELESATERIQSPMQRLEHALHPWVAYAIVPVFALANAGVVFGRDVIEIATSSVSLGIIIGLVVGKQAGIMVSTYVLVRTGLAMLPAGVTVRHLYGASCLAGLGFTMSLFISDLAFQDQAQLNAAKIGILAASSVAAILGAGILSIHRSAT